MATVTKFPTRTSIPERMGDFTRHLRQNGFRVGMQETEMGLQSLEGINLSNPLEVRMALKAVCCADLHAFGRFDDLFNAFWLNQSLMRTDHQQTKVNKPDRRTIDNLSKFMMQHDTGNTGENETPDGDRDGEANSDGEGKLLSTRVVNKNQIDMREYLQSEDRAAAEQAAQRIAAAIRYKRSRRRKADRKGAIIDLRRVIRRSIGTGGEPVQLLRRRRPDRPSHLVAILDVSGSMTIYARVFLAFIRGLIDVDRRADAFLFHTNLMNVSDALRDSNSLRAVNRLSMMAQGFGGGTRIGYCLHQFNTQYASRIIGRRSVVIIMSDGYDTGDSKIVGTELSRLRRKGCKIIWLNPLLGWKHYEPVAASMSAALPYLDKFSPCNTLESLAALEFELEQL